MQNARSFWSTVFVRNMTFSGTLPLRVECNGTNVFYCKCNAFTQKTKCRLLQEPVKVIFASLDSTDESFKRFAIQQIFLLYLRNLACKQPSPSKFLRLKNSVERWHFVFRVLRRKTLVPLRITEARACFSNKNFEEEGVR